MEDTLSLALIVGCGGLIAVGCVVAEHAEDDHGELSGGGGDGLGFADAAGEAAVEGTEGVIAPGEAHDGEAEVLAARLAEGWVAEPRSLPPDILLWGERVSQEAKWLGEGQRLMSSPISEMTCSAA